MDDKSHKQWVEEWIKHAKKALRRKDLLSASEALRAAAYHEAVAAEWRNDRQKRASKARKAAKKRAS